MMACKILVGALMLLVGASAEKIVWFPFFNAMSHQMLGVKIGQELSKRGHEFIIVNADTMAEEFASRIDYTGITALPFKHPIGREKYEELVKELGPMDPVEQTQKLVELDVIACQAVLDDDSVKQSISDADFVVADATSRCGMILQEYLKIKGIAMFLPTTFYDPYILPRFGGPNNLAYVPQIGSRLSADMDFGERIHNHIVGLVHWYVDEFVNQPGSNALRAKLGGIAATSTESLAKVGLLIAQDSWALEFPRPVPPSLKMVGPILSSPAKPLPADLEEWVAAAPNGVMVVSFGTTCTTTQEMVDKMIEAFAKLEMHVLWKIPRHIKAETLTVSKNVKTVTWMPQNDLLGHNNVKAFFSHGGLNGVSESAYHGVPLIGFPMLGDQWDNIARLQFRGMAEVIDSLAFTAEDLLATINNVVNTPSYTENAAKISSILKDTPKTPAALAADWIEFGIRHDNANFFTIPLISAPWYVRTGFDAVATLVFVLVVLPFMVIRRCCCTKSAAKTKSD
eukprot:m.94498 g.94498  ORF g.94498 m.94498 type:complete len:511 (+) comp26725_c0_seq1:90-1622(+)